MASIDMTPENTYIVSYPNDMLDGILWEDDEHYVFISAHSEGYQEILDGLDALGVESFCMDETVDLSQPPHSWVVGAIERLIIRTAEDTRG